MLKLGSFNEDQVNRVEALMSCPDTIFSALLDKTAMWDSENIEHILSAFPKDVISTGDLFLIITECMGNAVLHGHADLFGIHARQRQGILLLSFYQNPPLLPRITLVLKLACKHDIRAYSEHLPGGLGLPILLKIVHRITVTQDLTRLQLWIRTSKD